MRQVTGLTSTYSSDEFGVCSALFELGGMVVMHDASGCNSTYTTHDEPRWYDMDSMIFISAISEMEAVMGDDEKFITDLVETATNLSPKFVALVGAPIPYMIGTDLDAIAKEVERRTKIPSFAFAANGMHDYTVGVSMAMEKVAELFAVEGGGADLRLATKNILEPGQNSLKCEAARIGGKPLVNILGATPLDFSVNGSVKSMVRWLKENGMKMRTCFSMDCTLEDVKRLGAADANLVVSAGGLAAAKLLEKRFGMPYVVGVPVGEKFSGCLAQQLRQATETGKSMVSYIDVEAENAAAISTKKEENIAIPAEKENSLAIPEKKEKSLAIIGEAVYSCSLAAAIRMERDLTATVLCPLDIGKELIRSHDAYTPEEDDIIAQLQNCKAVIADPLYASLTGDLDFFGLPHTAFSGRIHSGETTTLMSVPLT